MKIGFLVVNEALSTSISWPIEMWQAAKAHASASNLSAHTDFEITTVGINTILPAKRSLLSITPETTISECGHFDLIYLPALWRNPRKAINTNAALIPWLAKQYENGSSICATGTGCCFIAEAGLLDNKPATTHWFYFESFAKSYPLVLLKRDHFITEADRLFCAASINSLADLTIHHISNHFGKSTANHVQRHFSHEIRAPYENQIFSEKSYSNHVDESVLHIQLWMQDNYEKPISIANIAKQNGMSERTLTRKFKAACKKTPSEYLQSIRIKNAQEFIQHSNLSISEISERTGFYDSSHLAKGFRKHTGISPSKYKQMVRKKLFRE